MGKQVPFYGGQQSYHEQGPISEESETLENISILQAEAYLCTIIQKELFKNTLEESLLSKWE